jgi:hypothetical protein
MSNVPEGLMEPPFPPLKVMAVPLTGHVQTAATGLAGALMLNIAARITPKRARCSTKRQTDLFILTSLRLKKQPEIYPLSTNVKFSAAFRRYPG